MNLFQLCSCQLTKNSFIITCVFILLSLEVIMVSVWFFFWTSNLWKLNLPLDCFLIMFLNAVCQHICISASRFTFWFILEVPRLFAHTDFFDGCCPLSLFQEVKAFVNCDLLYLTGNTTWSILDALLLPINLSEEMNVYWQNSSNS